MDDSTTEVTRIELVAMDQLLNAIKVYYPHPDNESSLTSRQLQRVKTWFANKFGEDIASIEAHNILGENDAN